MENLKVLTNELIPVYESNEGIRLVDGRELHEFLEVGKDFTTWIKDKIAKYDFEENKDYSLTLTKTGERSNVTKHDYTLTVDMAKELSMTENNEKGKEARKYFIAVEKKFKEIVTDPYKGMSKELQAIFALDGKQQEFNNRLSKIEDLMTIETGKQKILSDLVTSKVMTVLGGKEAPAYNELSKKAYSQCWRDYKRILNVASYKDTAVKDFERAKEVISGWKPSRELELMIMGSNSQMRV
jgi:anti-repressor protein